MVMVLAHKQKIAIVMMAILNVVSLGFEPRFYHVSLCTVHYFKFSRQTHRRSQRSQKMAIQDCLKKLGLLLLTGVQ